MLALDSTIGCIEVSESELVALFRSAPVTRSASPNAPPETVEAYVCAVQKKASVKVYLSFVINDRSIYVYAVPGKGASEAEYPKQMEEALEYAKAMGCSPQPVDLSYSPAMREVVVRNTKILRLAGTKGASPLKHGLSGAPTLPMIAKPAPEEVPATGPVVPVSSPSPAYGDAGTEEEEKSASKQTLAGLERERLALQADRDTLAERLKQTAARHQEATAALAAARETCAELTRERDALLLQREQAGDPLAARNEELAALRSRAAALAEQLETLTPRYGDLEREHDLMVENLAVARLDIARLGAEREAVLESSRQAAKRQEEAAARLEESRRELERLGGEGEAASQLVAALKGEKELLAEELEGVRRELTDAEAARDALRRQLAAVEAQRDEAETEKEALGREPERLFSEQPPLSGEREKATGCDPFPPRDLPALHDAAGAAHPAFGEPFPAQFPEFEMPEQQAPQRQERQQMPEEPVLGGEQESNVQEPVFVPLGDLHDDGFFSAADEGDQVRFFLERGRSAIEYAAPDEVLELHRSVNNAYLSPEGMGGQENCQAFICSLRKGEAREVFAAIYGTKSGRTTLYLPEQQPADDDSYARTMRGAMSFAEEVGLMMEPVTLEGAAAKKLERLKQCPALRLAEQK